MSKIITLKDIAKEAGTSISTVHRVLNNKEGVGEELREKILKISKELGYSVNFAASTLKKKTTHFVAVLPKNNEASKYYTNYLVDGYQNCKIAISNFNINFEEYYFSNEQELFDILKKLIEDQSKKIEGMLLFPIASERIEIMINRFYDRGIPVVIIENDIKDINRLSCIKPNVEVAGSLAGELLCKFIKNDGKILIADGIVTAVKEYNKNVDLNSLSCQQTIERMNPNITIERISDTTENNQLYESIYNKLKNDKNIVGIYATTARNTVAVGKAISDLGLVKEIQFIGSELFEESIEMLKRSVIDTIISKNPYSIGYGSLEILFNSVIKNEKLNNEYMIDPSTIFKSNLHLFTP